MKHFLLRDLEGCLSPEPNIPIRPTILGSDKALSHGTSDANHQTIQRSQKTLPSLNPMHPRSRLCLSLAIPLAIPYDFSSFFPSLLHSPRILFFQRSMHKAADLASLRHPYPPLILIPYFPIYILDTFLLFILKYDWAIPSTQSNGPPGGKGGRAAFIFTIKISFIHS